MSMVVALALGAIFVGATVFAAVTPVYGKNDRRGSRKSLRSSVVKVDENKSLARKTYSLAEVRSIVRTVENPPYHQPWWDSDVRRISVPLAPQSNEGKPGRVELRTYSALAIGTDVRRSYQGLRKETNRFVLLESVL